MAGNLRDTAQAVLDAVTDALSDALRPVCESYVSLGIPVIASCCDCDDEGTNGEVSIHFRRLFDADSSTLNEVQRVRPCRGGVIAAQYRIILARCSPIINERGELPESGEITDAALDQMLDSEIMWQALVCSGMDLRIDDISPDLSEPGMCSLVYMDVTVAVTVPPLPTGSM